jgi:hypothetical protein
MPATGNQDGALQHQNQDGALQHQNQDGALQRQMCKALLLLTVGGLVLSRRANLGLKKRNSAARPSKIDIFLLCICHGCSNCNKLI